MKTFFFLAILILSTRAFSFDTTDYREISLDDLISKSVEMMDRREHEDDMELILPPNVYTISAKLQKMPYKCDTKFVFVALESLEYLPKNAPDSSLPPINTCIEVSSNSGVKVASYIQDPVSTYIPKELNIGDKITLYVIWLFSTDKDKLPGLLINDFSSK